MFLTCSGQSIHQRNKTCSLKKGNLQADSFLQNNCIVTKAVEIMSENNQCDRLRNSKAVPEQAQQRFVSPCVPQLQEIFLLISLCQGFDRKTDRDGRNVQMYNILLSQSKTWCLIFLANSSLICIFLQLFYKFAESWKSSQFLVFCIFLSWLAFTKITRWALLQMLEAN